MAILKFFLITLGLASVTLAVPTYPVEPRVICANPVLRKEWSAATASERASYTKAVLCLATKKSKLGLKSTLYDDFPWVHNQLFNQVHGVAQFLPWHRYFVHIYEQALRDCGYSGHQLYWDWVADSSAPASAKVWSPVDGFGGNGTNAATDMYTRCITDGPFTVLRPYYYNNDTVQHCIEREFIDGHPEAGLQEMIGWQYNADVIAAISSNTNYLGFHPGLEGGPHGAVHAGIAGAVGDMGPTTSPNDPIFFLHHTQVDRLWWLWQQQNPTNRTYDFAGIEWGGVPATLATNMQMLGLAPDRKVGDFMSTSTSDLCYKYI